MKIEQKGHTIIVRDTKADASALLSDITHGHKTYGNSNLIVDISTDASVTLKTIAQFKPLSKAHSKGKKSFVIVASGIDFTEVPDALVVVPTLQEAHDMIEMDEIERDLGF